MIEMNEGARRENDLMRYRREGSQRNEIIQLLKLIIEKLEKLEKPQGVTDAKD